MGPGVVRLRAGTAADEEPILELACEFFEELGDYDPILRQWLALTRTESLVAERDGTMVGFAVVAQRRPPGFLRRCAAELVCIGVTPALRRGGTGGRLLTAVESVAASWRASEIRLQTWVGNERAQRFFARRGFVYEGVSESRYPNGQVALDFVCPRTGRGAAAVPDEPVAAVLGEQAVGQPSRNSSR